MTTNQTAETLNRLSHPEGYKGHAALSPNELAARWGKCRQTIYNMIDAGELHSFKVRNSRLIPLSEILRIEGGEKAT